MFVNLCVMSQLCFKVACQSLYWQLQKPSLWLRHASPETTDTTCCDTAYAVMLLHMLWHSASQHIVGEGQTQTQGDKGQTLTLSTPYVASCAVSETQTLWVALPRAAWGLPPGEWMTSLAQAAAAQPEEDRCTPKHFNTIYLDTVGGPT